MGESDDVVGEHREIVCNDRVILFIGPITRPISEGGVYGAAPGVNIGLFCSTPMVALSRNVAPKHAMQMLLSGDLIDTADRRHKRRSAKKPFIVRLSRHSPRLAP